MSYLRYLARRFGFAVFSLYAVVSLAFLLGSAMIQKNLSGILASARYNGASPERIAEIRAAFRAERGLDVPLHERYVSWLVDVTTLQWGQSVSYDASVIAVLDGRVQTTLAYVLPGVAVGVLAGVLLGVLAALTHDRLPDWLSRFGAYVAFGVPSFAVALVAIRIYPGLLTPQYIAVGAVALSVVAGQLRFARTAALERSGEPFVTFLKAKGTGGVRLARHVLRNAALPIISLSVTELVGVLVLQIYVLELVLGIDGIAQVSLTAIRESDVALVIWTTMVVVVVGITGNFLKDALYGLLDPRVTTQ
ncbi:ABC transporter permease subunit [Halosegnis rubeus]|jgi:peptide/nickel transport system permease protein|uniref:ABC transporter permease subunit n=1 Tax=Halosegnis rubeus TaxID=2212850 RepID=A0A5N5UH48_9EURY|nr:ABC transporter permease [Halosegnis rubeus]KAB7514721.1 ABC transporter permease subunit [Halosegnis rubeus]KAB7518034.1 ABC transporter permease subunit [Halosegnis rubeus]